MDSREFEQAIADEMARQRVDALKMYRLVIGMADPSSKDRNALIDAMRVLGKNAADLRKDIDAVNSLPTFEAIVERWGSEKYQREVAAVVGAAKQHEMETARLLNERHVTQGKLNMAVESLRDGFGEEAHAAKEKIRRIRLEHWEVLGLEKPEISQYL